MVRGHRYTVRPDVTQLGPEWWAWSVRPDLWPLDGVARWVGKDIYGWYVTGQSTSAQNAQLALTPPLFDGWGNAGVVEALLAAGFGVDGD